MSSVAAIVLAAGASHRLGTPKQLVRLRSETLLERAVRVAFEAGLEPVLGVLPAGLLIDPAPVGMVSVVNHEADEGIASSIRTGVRALAARSPDCSGAVLLACDQPAVTASHVRELAHGDADVVASGYSGRKGVPAYLPRAFFDTLLALRGDLGARDILRDARVIPLPGGELDIDTLQDLERARREYEE